MFRKKEKNTGAAPVSPETAPPGPDIIRVDRRHREKDRRDKTTRERSRPTMNPLHFINKGIRRRWLVNTLGTILAVVVLIVIIFYMLINTYFFDSARSGMEQRAESASNFFASYATSESDYLEMVNYYIASFTDSDKLELQFLDTSGQIYRSSYGLFAGSSPGTSDIESALNTTQTSAWIGNDPNTGEHIMAVSTPVVVNGDVKGIMRLVTSLRIVDQQILMYSLIALGIAALLMAVNWLLNMYFLRNILDPLSGITEITRRIAGGSYGIQIESNRRYDDEISDLTDAINDMSRQIGQHSALQQEFIASVSHELRTPLTAINGWGETLLDYEDQLPEEVQGGLRIIVSEARRLTTMVEELLEFSRIQDGRFTLNVEQLDIKAEFEDAVYTYRQFFRKEGIQLNHTDCQQEFPPISGDPERLRQVFSNLLDNAAKHGGSGKRIDTAIGEEAGYVAIVIRDYGPGVPEDELPLIKTKFYKGSSKARGSGIGLAVCDEIVERHGGKLVIANADGGGCAVTVYLPLPPEG